MTKTQEELNSKLKELSDEEQKEVTGGISGCNMTEGIAGAYGESSGSRKPITVTGEVIDDCSVGVAIPMSWPDYRSYLGKDILINYCGTTVLARINDVGVLNGRSLDLQPGIFRAFGFKSCVDWGVRSISYCVL